MCSVHLCKEILRQITFFIGFDRGKPETHGTYSTTAKYAKEWLELEVVDGFPLNLRQRLENITSIYPLEIADAIQKSFVENNAVFHRKCTVRYGKDKLKR